MPMHKSKRVSNEIAQQEEQLANYHNQQQTDPENTECELAAHPEGYKRGGVVPIIIENETMIYYDETAAEWFPYNDEQ